MRKVIENIILLSLFATFIIVGSDYLKEKEKRQVKKAEEVKKEFLACEFVCCESDRPDCIKCRDALKECLMEHGGLK